MTTTAEVPAEVAPAVSERRAQLRPDIQALRAVAVGSVMLFHLWPNRLSGGYVGVDVFFVISGFLITSHLVAELGRAGRIRPAQFWARRAKRLVPASTIVLVTTCLFIVNWAPHNLWRQYFHEIVTSTLQVQNWQLANNSVNYLAANNPPSPTQHFWSLSVEEQFYVCLPLLIIAAAAIAGKLGLAVSRVVAGMLALIFVASLVYSVWLTSTTPSVAYFSTFTRAWEFAAGALLACLAPMARRVNPVVPWVGLAAITLACVSYSGGTAFPGYAAALPVGGAVLVIWSARDTLFGRLGLVPPVAFLGRVSYAAYLWHWPLVVLVPEITGRPLDTVDKLSIIGFTLLVSWLSTKFVEETIRFSPRLLGRRRPRTVAAWCASAMALVVIFGSLGDNWQKHRNDDLALQTTQIVEKMPPCLGAQAMDPALAPCVDHALDGLLVPAPAQAASDDANRQECWGYDAAGQPKLCHLGPASGYTKKIYAIGDSHSNNLIGVYAKIADHNNW
ncbi:MAG: acyltransferase family protein, partial [Actinocrinis sp.]